MRTVVFYLKGTKCAVRHAIALYFLRKVWRGRVLVLAEGPMLFWLGYLWRRLRIAVQRVPEQRTNCIFTRKPAILAALPEGEYVYLDSDTVPVMPIEPLFDFLKEKPFVIAQFSKWHCGRFKRMRSYRVWKQALQRDVDPELPMVNLGMIAFALPDAKKVIDTWLNFCQRLDVVNLEDTDEAAMHATLDVDGQSIKVIPHCWNQSARVNYRFEDLSKHRKRRDQPRILHFHGDRHFRDEPPFPCQSSYWLKCLREIQTAFPGFIAKQLDYGWGDVWYQRWLDCSGLSITKRIDFCSLIDVKEYKIGVEVGVSDGAFSANLLNSSLHKLYSVDNWAGSIPGRMGSKEHKAIAVARLTKYGERSVIIDDESLKAVEIFDDGSLDFVYVDAGHRYFECMMDLQAWWPKLRAGGCMAGHDWTVKRGWGVIQAVQEFTKQVGKNYYLTTKDEPRTHESFYIFR